MEAPTGSRTSPTLPGPAPNVGDEVPTFIHDRDDGGTFELTDHGLYVLTFWAEFNRDSNLARPYFAQLAKDFGSTGVRFAAVYIGDPPVNPGPAPYAIIKDDDGSLASMYNVKRVPRIFVISDGRVELVHNTFLPGNYDLLREDLEELVSQETNGE